MKESAIWKLIDIYFRENPQALVKHHIDSYNEFYEEHIFQMFREMNPIQLDVDYDNDLKKFRSKCLIYMGGKEGNKVYFGKPVIHDPNNQSHFMYPNECRLRNMTYAATIHYDVDIEYTRILRPTDTKTKLDQDGYALHDIMDNKETNEDGNTLKKDYTPSEAAALRENTENFIKSNTQFIKMKLEKIFLGRFPIMVQSNLCIFHKVPREMRYALGECKNDIGGYFIIDGKEKAVIPQEAFGDNMLNIYEEKDEKYTYAVDIKSVSENVSKPVRHMSIKILASTKTMKRENIGVFIPNAGNKPIPLFIVFRALGVLTDKDIISYCLLQESIPESFSVYFNACIHDAASILTQNDALKYISMFVKGRSISRTMRILADYFLPHVGEMNFLEKAYHLGYIVNRLLNVATGVEPVTDRDSYKYKRLRLIGPLIKDLFREYYAQQQKYIKKFFQYRYEFGKDTYSDLSKLIHRKYQEAFSNRMVEDGFRKAFKGSWGAYSHTKIVGIVQDLNRLSHNGMISHLRKTNLPMDSSVKLVGPRVLHGSQWGVVDPIDTPDGGNVGLHKHLSILTHVTTALSREPMIEWLKTNVSLKLLRECSPLYIGRLTKVFVNGFWVGCVADPQTVVETIKINRRHGLIPIFVSVIFDITRNTIVVSCEGGRLCRPIFYKDINGKFVFNDSSWSKIESVLIDPDKKHKWEKIISGFHPKSDKKYNLYKGKYYTWEELYQTLKKGEHISHEKAILEYIDTQETEGSYIAMSSESVQENSRYTHCEIHPSTCYGVMCNLINYLEHNPASRNSFSCGQSKQACSLYSTNYQVRMDKTAVLLNNGQIPIVKSRYLEYINHQENPYGENAIVAIMCYTGYNVEDAVLINEAALQRGLFRTTYYTTYEAHEEKEVKNDIVMKETLIGNVSHIDNIQGMKPDYDYGQLNEFGLIPENTPVDDKTILIGKSTLLNSTTNLRKDESKVPKKGQLGIVDKSFITEGEEGQRIAKVRIREERIPMFGDKFASRAGQKGTVGMIISEENMPFTKSGVRPDMIINPHALPSRMTIGQMIECIVGKACLMEGTSGNCTAFYNRENKLGLFGEVLTKHNFHSSGDEIMYDGFTGKQVECSVFIGPIYYMRLKHMVKDKINYRSTGPLTALTRQPVHGRANDGGLRIGEMERDAVISHGLNAFLNESMMERADGYQMAVCNKTGMVAIYNPAKDLLISPSADGPIQYSGSVEKDQQLEVQQITKHGRSFSIVRVPYSLKLLMQELQAMNIRMHLITDDNVNQFENMKFSNNIDLCIGQENATPQMVIDQIKEGLESSPDKEEKNTEMIQYQYVAPTPPYDYMQPIPVEMVGKYPDLEIQGYSGEQANIYLAFSDKEKRAFNKNYDFMTRQKVLDELVKRKLGIYGSDPLSPDGEPPGYLSPQTPDGPPPPKFKTPQSPDGPPPQWVQQGGNHYNTQEINEGMDVLYNGDVKPDRRWKIHSTLPDGRYTIDTEDLDYLNVEDSRKIVEDKDIQIPDLFDYKPLGKNYDHIHFPEFMDMTDNANPLGPDQTSLPHTDQDGQKPMVNIIKIFNQGGVDQSTGTDNADGSQSHNNNDSNHSEIIPSSHTGLVQDTDIPSISTPSPIDFKNLIIKKEN